MYKNAVLFKGVYLAPASKAYQLHQDKKMDELNKHFKEVMNKEHKTGTQA